MIETNNAGEWKVRIDHLSFANRLNFYFYKPGRGGTTVVGPDGLMQVVNDGTYIADIRPTLSLSGFEGRQMMHALAETLANEDIRTPNDHTLKGQLEAQTAHLQDLRTLLKLNKTKTSGESK